MSIRRGFDQAFLTGALIKATDKIKSVKKDEFVKKGRLKLGDIRQHFNQVDNIAVIEKVLDKLEKNAKENNNIISLGTGFNNERVVGHS